MEPARQFCIQIDGAPCMSDRQDAQPPRKRKRNTPGKRPIILTARFNEQEKAVLEEKARHVGISKSAFIRFATLGTPLPRGRREPSVNEEILLRVLADLPHIKAELGKHGSNLNQIAYYLNSGRPVDRLEGLLASTLHEAQAFYENKLEQLRYEILRALGYERGGDKAA
jgi:hypothetical protein